MNRCLRSTINQSASSISIVNEEGFFRLNRMLDAKDIALILRKVREKVMTATGGKQQPWEYGSLTGGELVLSRVKR